eukprot:5321456-Prymnesium_polylepis.1
MVGAFAAGAGGRRRHQVPSPQRCRLLRALVGAHAIASLAGSCRQHIGRWGRQKRGDCGCRPTGRHSGASEFVGDRARHQPPLCGRASEQPPGPRRFARPRFRLSRMLASQTASLGASQRHHRVLRAGSPLGELHERERALPVPKKVPHGRDDHITGQRKRALFVRCRWRLGSRAGRWLPTRPVLRKPVGLVPNLPLPA